jgi:Fe-S oxidoreductase
LTPRNKKSRNVKWMGVVMAAEGQDGKVSGFIQTARCGRTLEEQIRDIKTYGNHGVSPVLRNMTLDANALGVPKDKARHSLMFGCYRPFSTPYLLRDVVRLLDGLGIDYTWLEKEYCCGLPLLPQIEAKDRAAALPMIRDFIRGNRELARDKGADQLVYCCAGCAHVAWGALPEAKGEHAYILDVLLDALEAKTLRAAPTTIAYFEGCHSSYKPFFPETSLNWERYRRFLDKIENLTIIDAPNTKCCKKQADAIVASAMENNISALVCACSGCNVALRQAGRGKVRVMSYPELLLQCFAGDEARPAV